MTKKVWSIISVFIVLTAMTGIALAFPVPPGPPANMVLQAVPTTVNSNGINFSTITATLTDSTGQPSPGANVYFNTNFGILSASFGLFPLGWLAISDDQGNATATISSASIGTATITAVTATGITSSPVTVNFMSFVTGNIAGQITYSNNGTGITGVLVSLTNASGVIATTTTNASGNYGFTGVLPGSYNVNSSLSRYFGNSTGVVVTPPSTSTVNQILWLKGDLNNNGISADAGDLVLMKRASIGEIAADFRYDLNNNGIFADAGDLVLMKRASIGEITLV